MYYLESKMGVFDYILIGLSASIDTFAVTISKGALEPNPKLASIVCSLWLSCFQVIMLLLGFFICGIFSDYLETFDHWIAFGIFFVLGAVMLKDSFSKKEKKSKNGLSAKVMLPLAVASSIDSLMIGITTSLLSENIAILCLCIAIFTCIFSCLGIFVGHKCGIKYKKLTSILGGVLLILLGVKILIEHLFF